MKEKLVLIGNGMAGVRTIEEILERDPDRYEITIFGEEKYPNYNRIMLSNVLQKKMEVAEIITNPLTWYEENNIRLVNHDPAIKIDKENKLVHSASGQEIAYDKCIIATGSRAFILPVEGSKLPGVVGFRTIDDTEAMLEAAKSYKKAVVIGGGLLGLEAAKGLVDQGMEVTVIHLEKWLMETQLDAKAGEMLKADLEKQGLKFLMEKRTEKILGTDHVTGITFSDGSSIETDLVVMSVGIRPEATLAREAGLDVNRGILVNDFMHTSNEHIYAVGECVEHNGQVYGLVAPLFEQGKVLADILTDKETAPYQGSTTFTSLKVSGCDLYSAGEIKECEGVNSIEAFDGLNFTYKKVFVRENKIVGVVLYGDTSEGNRYYNILKKNEEIDGYTPVSLLHMAGEETSTDVGEWPDDEMICGCNGVTKGTIVSAIKEKELTSIAEVTKYTKAGGSCGKCKPLIGDILAYTLGGAVASGPTGICGCTSLTRDQIVTQIHAKHLTSSEEVYKELAFQNPEGCPKCRPAVNFYLNVAWPKEHADERESRYVNERMYGNIQNDGTYSVIPRMRGGKTDPQQLMLIAKVAEKYDVPMVKITGSQRIGLFGVKKEDMPKIWEELDMTAAAAYAKAVRSVKTCVGANFCRFGTQDSLGLGIKLEQRFEFIDTPHKFKMGVSACPRSCVESGVKDFGIIGVENGFQIYIGGNGGTEVKEAQLLTTVATEEEVIELCGAMLQFYRETGVYAERTAPWMDRLGFDKVKEVLLDSDHRKELIVRLDEAVEGRRGNPWEEVIKDEALRKDLYTVGRV
ncbi:nitrite reductase large subunit NirB [Candidatus Enterococcus clewellii]|uniref:Nitrite reductase [NAD(P)H], large subunit n=1 Tax=Candidatus Enterococcus clewellii TaxID=1834193 RepID=A0A242K504_9ENTE|nr:nitrite reductase large subunit NirB [Enterococcus sp. 9E7_DIV0242]OTP14608.1 nitrite reductase [NAD(P)H], large subunit [Enterococcus sp. 9E7_DIV0242]